MKVLITGATGQLGRALTKVAPAAVVATALDRRHLDITDEAVLGRKLDELRPDVLINAAAYTAVDKAESDRDRAYAINAQAVGSLARACAARGVKLIQVSTDFVFDGTRGRPYRPDDATAPLNVYGASKLEGERLIQATAGLRWLIVRTAWVYASYGHNFMLTMLRLFRERPRVTVVADQIGCPTSANSLAQCVWQSAVDTGPSAILQFTDAGVASWYDFAVAIYEEARALDLIQNAVDVVPIRTEQYPTPAQRPSFSVLERQPTLERLGLAPIHWRASLRQVLQELQA